MTSEWDLPAVWYIDLWPAADPMVISTEVEDMNHIQVFKPLPQHPSSDDFMAPMIGRNVVATANGPTWKMLRNAMNPSFASGHIKHLSKVIVEEVTTFRATLQQLAKQGKPFDLETKGAEVIFDVIARIVYNFPLEAQRKGSQTLSDLRELVHLVEQSFSLNPLNKLKVWMRRDKLSKRLDASIRKVVADRYQILKHEGVVPNRKDPYSTLDLMLREQLMQGKELKEIDREFDQLLITNIKGLLLGGHGTTNDTLCVSHSHTHLPRIRRMS
jgi:cytochrome P450